MNSVRSGSGPAPGRQGWHICGKSTCRRPGGHCRGRVGLDSPWRQRRRASGDYTTAIRMGGAFQGVHLDLRSTTDVLDDVQQVAEDVCRQVGLDDESIHWTSMAVRECVINAITHGNRSNPEKLVSVDFALEEQRA